jgi:endonuclease G, mitochondrial
VLRNKSSIKYRLLLVFTLFLAISITTPLCAATTECPSQYLGGVAPDIISAQKAEKAQELCFDNFAIMHSGISRTPLWSAEHLTRSNLQGSKGLRRVNDFHAEDRLPADERSALGDYSRSGFDRGHMSPSGDMPTETAQWQSFSLSNMIPQDPDNNRHLWEGIESAVRTLAKKTGDLYVITGPLYLKDTVKRLNGRVLVPTNIFKIVFDPNKNMGAAFFVKNEPGNEWHALSISQLEELAGIDFFPNLSISIKQSILELPEPTPYNNRHHPHASFSSVLRSMLH